MLNFKWMTPFGDVVYWMAEINQFGDLFDANYGPLWFIAQLYFQKREITFSEVFLG